MKISRDIEEKERQKAEKDKREREKIEKEKSDRERAEKEMKLMREGISDYLFYAMTKHNKSKTEECVSVRK